MRIRRVCYWVRSIQNRVDDSLGKDESLKRRIVRRANKLLPNVLKLSRHFHAFCIGAPKTGTTTVADMLQTGYRSRHEPNWEETLPLAVASARNELPTTEVMASLYRHDSSQWLEMEASHYMGLLVDELQELFPDARFVVTFRDCVDWLDSIVNHQARQVKHFDEQWFAPWRALFELLYQPTKGYYHSSEHSLRTQRIGSIESHLQAYAKHYDIILRAVDPNRMIVLRTERLSESTYKLASFLGIPVSTIRSGIRSNVRTHTVASVLAEVDRDYLMEAVDRCCGQLSQRLLGLTN